MTNEKLSKKIATAIYSKHSLTKLELEAIIEEVLNKHILSKKVTKKKTPTPVKLEIGNFYWFRYLPAKGSRWYKAKITKKTPQGFYWQENYEKNVSGIVAPEQYEIRECTPHKELIESARALFIKKDFNGYAHHTNLPELFAEFYNQINPQYNEETN